MEITLTQEEKVALEQQHRGVRDKRVADRIKAVLLSSEGWRAEQIKQALRIHPETVREHLKEWVEQKKLKPENGGSSSKLDEGATQALIGHLEARVYTRVMELCAYVLATYGVRYTVSGMTKWLKQQGFRYKKPTTIPAKANPEQQAAFITYYHALKASTPSDEPIVFMDAVHPTMATKVSQGWIRKGQRQLIQQSASRTRVNLIGAIELASLQTVTQLVPTVNAQTTGDFLRQLKTHYPQAKKLHVILDQSGYHRSHALQTLAQQEAITLHYLPPYSPNLNPIERLWKFMNEHVRNNTVFASPAAFRDAITQFFEHQLPQLSAQLRSRITDHFQVLNAVPSG